MVLLAVLVGLVGLELLVEPLDVLVAAVEVYVVLIEAVVIPGLFLLLLNHYLLRLYLEIQLLSGFDPLLLRRLVFGLILVFYGVFLLFVLLGKFRDLLGVLLGVLE